MKQVHESRAQTALGTLVLAALLLGFASGPLLADGWDITTDRPDFTESSTVVEPGRIQFEGGLSFGSDLDVRTVSGPEFLFRFGILPRLELRAQLPDYIRSTAKGEKREQLGNALVGAKLQFGPFDVPWGAALIPAISVPTDRDVTGDPAPQLGIAWSSGLPAGWSISGLLGRVWLEGAGRGPDVFFPSASIGRRFSPDIGAFLEWAAEYPERGEAVQMLHHGYTFAVPPDGQFDVHLGVGLSRVAPDFFIGVGFSVRH